MQRKILIAEDNTELLDMARNYLIKAGHTVYQAFDGAQALETASKMKPDLLLLDIMMPVYDGFQVCETLVAVRSKKGKYAKFIIRLPIEKKK